jgi:hypothetical protein
MKRLALICTLFLFGAAAHAMHTVKEYRDIKAKGGIEWTTLELVIGGFGSGLEVANVLYERRGAQPLYCQPPKLALAATNYIKILDDEIERSPPPDTTWIETILPFALAQVFPCAKK